MNIKDLKAAIETKNVKNFMIWQLEDNSSYFIAEQYYKQIAKDKDLTINIIESLDDIQCMSFIGETFLYIYKLDDKEIKNIIPKLKDYIEYSLIVITNEYADESILIPKLADWQLCDFISLKAEGIKNVDLFYLISQYQDKYQLLLNDLDKICIFPVKEQQDLLDYMIDNNLLNSTSITQDDLNFALLKRGTETIKNILLYKDHIELDIPKLVGLLLANFKSIICIQHNKNINYKDAYCASEKQYNLLCQTCYSYNDKELTNIYTFLANVDYLYIASGISNDMLLDYILCEILGGE